jgi:hypothetical protein
MRGAQKTLAYRAAMAAVAAAGAVGGMLLVAMPMAAATPGAVAWNRAPGGAAGPGPAGPGSDARGSQAIVELVSPQPRAVLAAGSTALLEWAPQGGLKQLAWADEWEAFLSLDGGRSYPVRITPHLDLDLHQASWAVPAAPSSDVRLLLRFGNERREVEIELPQRFSIAASPWLPAPDEPALWVARRGEAARPGEAGTVLWAEGSRRGTGRRLVAAASYTWRRPHRRRRPVLSPEATAGLAASRTGRGAPLPARAGNPMPHAAAGVKTLSHRRLPSLPPLEPLLQTARRNE